MCYFSHRLLMWRSAGLTRLSAKRGVHSATQCSRTSTLVPGPGRQDILETPATAYTARPKPESTDALG